MLNFFETIISYIQLAWECLLNFISTLLALLSVLVSAITIPNLLVSHIGGIIASSAVIVVGISVIKLLLGRSNE